MSATLTLVVCFAHRPPSLEYIEDILRVVRSDEGAELVQSELKVTADTTLQLTKRPMAHLSAGIRS